MFERDKEIILKGDDHGNHLPTNKGIEALVEKGLMTDTAVLVTFTGEKERDDLLSAIDSAPMKDDPGVGILLHVNLVTGKPVSNSRDVSSLVTSVEDGVFRRPPEPTSGLWAEYAETLVPEEVRREIDAQVERFIELFGHLPHALDSHNISLYFPPGDEVGIEVALELGLPITFPKKFGDQLNSDFDSPGPFPETILSNEELLATYREKHIPTADNGFVEYFNRYPTFQESVKRLALVLDTLSPGVTEFFFHPGHPEYTAVVEDPRYERGKVRDYQTLTHPQITSRIRSLRLASYKQLYEQARTSK